MPHSHVLYISKTFTRWSTHSLFVHTLGWLSLFKKEYAHVALYKMDSVCYCLKNQIAMNEKWIFDMTVVLKNEAQNKILWLLILWNVMILKLHNLHTAEIVLFEPFSVRKIFLWMRKTMQWATWCFLQFFLHFWLWAYSFLSEPGCWTLKSWVFWVNEKRSLSEPKKLKISVWSIQVNWEKCKGTTKNARKT